MFTVVFLLQVIDICLTLITTKPIPSTHLRYPLRELRLEDAVIAAFTDFYGGG
jgi:hypothetical protein